MSKPPFPATNPVIPLTATPANSREEREAQGAWLAHVAAGRIGVRVAPSRAVVLGRLRNELVLSGGRATLGDAVHHPLPPVRGQGGAA